MQQFIIPYQFHLSHTSLEFKKAKLIYSLLELYPMVQTFIQFFIVFNFQRNLVLFL